MGDVVVMSVTMDPLPGRVNSLPWIAATTSRPSLPRYTHCCQHTESLASADETIKLYVYSI